MNTEQGLNPEQVNYVRDFIMLLSEKVRDSTQDFQGLSKISQPELLILHILSQHNSLMVKDIAAQLSDISHSTLTRMLDRLEVNGYIVRVLNRHDRRSFLIKLAPNGQELANSHNQLMGKMAQTMLEALTPVERLMLIELYTKIWATLADADLSADLLSVPDSGV